MNTPKIDMDLTRTEQIQDQCRAMLRDRYGDITRIAEQGPDGSEFDVGLIRAVFHTVLGGMLIEAYKSEADADPAAEDQP